LEHDNINKLGAVCKFHNHPRYKEYSELLKPQIIDSILMMKEHLDSGKNILVEGANAALLDIDFGTYPYVTSSNTTVGGVMSGLGVPPKVLQCTVGVVRGY
jgi:adenylosuccinate synthase